jgi:hypothetical protein
VDKQLLFIGSRFFGYEKLLTDLLRARGWSVTFVSDCPPNKVLFKILKKTSLRLARIWADKYYAAVLSELRGRPFQRVFVLKGEAITSRTLRMVRENHPEARFVSYFWDSLSNLPFGHELLAVSDVCWSFDPVDVKNHAELRYWPLFYADAPAPVADQQKTVDLLFVGTARRDRYQLASKVRDSLPQGTSVHFRFYWPVRALHALNKVIDGKHLRNDPEHIFVPVSRAELNTLTRHARVVLDIEHVSQRGLTMRTIEALGAGVKLATTNPHIRDLPFFDHRQFYVIDRREPKIPEAFIREAFVPIDDGDRRAPYSISAWVEKIILA